jgi:hypothetical protein
VRWRGEIPQIKYRIVASRNFSFFFVPENVYNEIIKRNVMDKISYRVNPLSRILFVGLRRLPL